MDKFRGFWSFSQRDNNSFLLSELSLGAVFIVLLLLLQLPGMYVSGKIADAEVAVYQSAPSALDLAEARLINEASWFDPSYSVGLSEKIIAGRQLLNEDNVAGAEVLLEQAKNGNLDGARELALEAIVLANQAVGLADEVNATLDQNIVLRDQAFAQYELLKAAASVEVLQLNTADRRFTVEGDRYLIKYTNELVQKLESASNLHITKNQHTVFADRVLPGLDSVEWRGDPLLAIEEIEQALVMIDEINTLTAYVTSRLDLLAEAEQNAASTLLAASSKIGDATAHLKSLEVARGYSPNKALKVSYEHLLAATVKLSFAQETLDNPVPVENKVDHLLAYESALASLDASAAAIRVANEVVAADDNSAAKLASFSSAKATAQSAIGRAESAEDILDRYHADSTWRSVSSNISDADALLRNAETFRSEAQTARTNQDFFLANQKAQSALDALTNIGTLCNAVVSMKDNLEDLRLYDWPSARSTAESAISSARTVINSSHTNATLTSANSYLTSANSDASAGKYASAISNAQSAVTAANNAKSKAESDEQDYQDDIEATRQAEISAEETRNAPPPPPPPSFDFDSDSGGSSSSGSGSSSGGDSSSGSGDSGSFEPGSGDSCAFGCD